MINITPDPSRLIRVPTLDEFDFELQYQEVETVLTLPDASEVDVDDMRFLQSTSASVRIDGQVSCLPLAGDPQVTYESADETKATVSQTGAITTTGTGAVKIDARTRYLTRSVTHNARTNDSVTASEFLYYLPGTVGRAAVDTVDALMPSGNTALFTTKNHSTQTYVRNPSVWCDGMDWTGVSPWNSTGANRRGGTLISPRHVMFCQHSSFFPANGATIRFVAADGTVVNRTLSAAQYIGVSDIRIGLLDEAVPETIAHYPVLPADWRDYLTLNPARCPVVCSDQEQKALVRDWTSVGAGRVVHDFGSGDRASASETLITGDSGQPVFLWMGTGLPILLGLHWSSNSCPNSSNYISEINATMATLGGGYELTIADLSAYSNHGD